MRRSALALAATAVFAVLFAGPARAVPATARDSQQGVTDLVLAHQSTLVNPEGTFSASVVTSGLAGATTLRVAVHDRARSRSELADANRGSGLRNVVRSATAPIADLPVDPDGGRRFTLALSGGDQRSVTTPGVYPTELAALDPSGRVVGSLVTDLVVRPSPSDAMPPLSVAVLADLGTDLGHLPDTAAAQGLADALAAVPEVPATLAVGPAWIAQVARSPEPSDTALVSALRALASGRPLLTVPFVDTSPDALAAARTADELPHQLARAATVARELLGTTPSQSTWLAGADLGSDGLRLISALGFERALVAPAQVERVVDGVLSPARSFVLAPPKEAGRRPAGPDVPVRALLTDTRSAETLRTDEEPALVAARATADLAMLWFEQPGTPRSVVVPVEPSIDPRTVQELLRALRTVELFRPVTIDDAVDAALALEDGAGAPLRRSLIPTDPREIPSDVGRTVRSLRARRTSVEAMVGADNAALIEIDRHLLRATANTLSASGRRRELGAGQAAVAKLVAAVSAPDSITITLTAREGTVPLTLRNTTGGPISVRLRFASSKLELPEGDERTLTLTDPITRLDIAVRTRSSGAFPFTVEVASPDGGLELASTTYSVRSTAVSGVGLLLSVGAGLFLVVWWARHWSQSKRSEKLVPEPGTTTP